MDELIRIAMRHEKILNSWGPHLNKDFKRQKSINRWLGFGVAALAGLFVVEDLNLYQTDKKLKALEKELEELRKATAPVEEGDEKNEV